MIQVYLKLQSRCLLFPNESRRRDKATPDLAETAAIVGGEKKVEMDEESDEAEEDDLWSRMEMVGGGRKRVKCKSN